MRLNLVRCFLRCLQSGAFLAFVLVCSSRAAYATGDCADVCNPATPCNHACLIDGNWTSCQAFNCCQPIWQYTGMNVAGRSCEMYDGQPDLWVAFARVERYYANQITGCGPATQTTCTGENGNGVRYPTFSACCASSGPYGSTGCYGNPYC